MHVLLCIFVCYLKCVLKCLLEGEQQKCTNGGKTTQCILLPLQMLSNFIQMNVLRSPPDKFPRNFPPFLDNMKRLTKFMHFIRLDNQSYSNFIKFFIQANRRNKTTYFHIYSFIILQQFETYRLNNAFLDNLSFSMNVIFFEIMNKFFSFDNSRYERNCIIYMVLYKYTQFLTLFIQTLNQNIY